MTTPHEIFAMMAAMAILNVFGSLALKSYAGSDRELLFLLGCGAYVLGAAFYVHLLRGQSLAVLAMASTLAQLGLLTALSIWLHGEKFNLVQFLGLGTGFMGLAVAMLAASS